jgi:hypothetical protein
MNIFKKTSQGIGNVFKKASDVGDDVFKKATGIAEKISKGSKQAQSILGQVSRVSEDIASNPITQSLPFGQQIAGGAELVSKAAKLGQRGAGQLSRATDIANYNKEFDVRKQLENVRDLQKRGEELSQTGRELRSVFI